MALSCEKGTFALRTTAGSQTVNLVDTGLTPKLVILWVVNLTATGYGTPLNFAMGAATAAAQDVCFGMSSDDAAAASNTNRRRASTRILHCSSNGNGTSDIEVDTTSFNAGNFIVNVAANATGTAQIIHYLVIGGTDLTNVRVGEITLNTVTGNQSSTTPGFQPDLVLFWTCSASATSTANGAFSIGVAKSSSDRMYSCIVLDDGNAAGGNPGNVQKDTACIGSLDPATPANQEWEADFVSMDANGFTINITDAPGTGWLVGFIAMKFTNPAMCDIFKETQRTSTGTKVTSGLSVIPKGLFAWGGARAASASIDTGATAGRFSMGGADGTREGCIAIHDTDAADPTQVAQRPVDTKAFATMTADSTTTAEADLTAFGSDGSLTLDWTTADATARELQGVVFGDTLPAADFVRPKIVQAPPVPVLARSMW